jgi:hypothetical protein
MMKIFNKIMVNKIYFLIMGFLFSSGLFAATIHVNSSTGDNASGNGSSGSPYKTFHKGYTEASSDDIIDLTGTFTWTDAAESGDAATTGYTIAKNLTIQGQGAGATYIQAASTENSADRSVFKISGTVYLASSTIIQAHGTYNSADRSVFKISGTVYLTNVTMADNDCSSNLGDGFFLLSSTRKQIKNKS